VKKWEQRLSPACSEVAQTYGTLENFRCVRLFRRTAQLSSPAVLVG
jgi:hypothetical protein